MRRCLPHLRLGIFGFALGASVSAVGLSDFGELHRMFTFSGPRMLRAFAGAVVLAGIAFAIRCRGKMPPRPLRQGTVPGAVVDGLLAAQHLRALRAHEPARAARAAG